MAGARSLLLRRCGKLCRLASAALLLAIVVEQAPHTVHHLFDHEEEAEPGCEFLAADERQHGVPVAAVRLEAPSVTEVDRSRDGGGLPPRALIAADARAPPRLSA
jgi:hypothetical protein